MLSHCDFVNKLNEKETDEDSLFDNTVNLYQGDCLDVMKTLTTKSVDLIAVDLPYGTTQNTWDVVIPFDELWGCFKNLLKENGVVVLTATQPFASKVVCSNLDWFKYDLIWEKTIGSGQLNISHQPLRVHESVLVFYNKKPTYNEQKTVGDPYKINRKVDYKNESYGSQKDNSKDNDGYRHAKSIIKIPNPRIKGGHPTQKPLELMDYIIKTFTNQDDVVLDCCMGSGTTGVSAINLGRRFIGIEKDENYFLDASKRIQDAFEKTQNFN